ncbi:MAG TPA: hypothetical protein VLQ91_00830 [Draconibacterium sp.]|nr:hypothetical protein [Draconibacterium sp.]
MKKLKTMSPIVVVLLFSVFIAAAQAQKIPITSSSENAAQLYYQSWAAYENAEIANGNNLISKTKYADGHQRVGKLHAER